MNSFSLDWRMINESCISRNYRGLPCDRYCEGHGESGKELLRRTVRLYLYYSEISVIYLRL